MKKIIFTLIIFFSFIKVFAIENIKIDNNYLSPLFETSIRKYNYYTNNSSIKIIVTSSKDEEVTGYGIFKLESGKNIFYINSSVYGIYEINVFKDYEKDNSSIALITSLNIENYDIDFNTNKFDYKINIGDEDKLNITYETIGNSGVKVIGNGNFNKTDNVIEIICGDKTYTIHALKSIPVVKNVTNNQEYKSMSYINKELLKIIIIVIGSIIVFGYFYLLFLSNKKVK